MNEGAFTKKVVSSSIRRNFLAYFAGRGHTVVPSSPLVPAGDETLLFTNAGMVQFKDVFLGLEKRSYRRAATAQKVVRAGGKHNDLDMVGRTPRHHTFFEMLGNFSFGDYFKEEAIAFAWEFLTKELDLRTDNLYITVFREDEVAEGIWRKMEGVGPGRILRLGEKDNFWSMGDSGPCGPCSEIHVDRGEDKACGPDCGLGKCGCDRWLEIWNLVFMQYSKETMQPLPEPSIDTGMGLERIASVLQGVDSNFDTDLFTPIMAQLELISGQGYDPGTGGFPFRVIADHVRAIAFLLAEGVRFSNEGRGYVLRRILRRAALYGRKLNIEGTFLSGVVGTVADSLGEAYPDLLEGLGTIQEAAKLEEERFQETLVAGSRRLEDFLARAKGGAVPGEEAFLLYDTYGFPLELTEELAGEKSLTVDREGFFQRLEEQRRRARAGREKTIYATGSGGASRFVGYDLLTTQSPVQAIMVEGREVKGATVGTVGGIILEATPFYAEAGGQVGDQGEIQTAEGLFAVENTVKLPDGRYLHAGKVAQGHLSAGIAAARVDPSGRREAARNHTATHLLQAALREVFGSGVKQTGSLVERELLRFDFTHSAPLTPDDLVRVEKKVNHWILTDLPVETEILSLDEAKDLGALAFFGDKYGETVRMVKVGDVSRELCGGTHVGRTGEIGLFHLVSEGGIGAGVRRLTAVSGTTILALLREKEEILRECGTLIRVNGDGQLPGRIEEVLVSWRSLQKERDRLALSSLEQEIQGAESLTVNGSALLVREIKGGASPEAMRDLAEQWRDRQGSGAIVLGTAHGGKPFFVAAVSRDLVERGVSAGNVLRETARVAGGGGGGRPDFAQAGGKDPAKLAEALGVAKNLLFETVGTKEVGA